MIGQHSLLQDLSCLMLILFFRPALGEIMDEHVHDDLIEKIRATSNQVEGIIDTENASSVKGMKYHVDLHAIVNAMITKEGHDLAHKLKDRLHKELPELGHVLIHVEPEKKC
jgi:divalent metal cation (Fe/Co/Zn/Cd) transporter